MILKTKNKFKITLINLGTFIMSIKVSCDISAIFRLTYIFDNILITLALICFVLEIVKNRYSFKTLIVCGLLGFLAIITGLITTNYAIVITVVFILAIRKKDLDNIISIIFITQLIFLIVHLFISVYFLIIGDSNYLYIIEKGLTRWKFCFVHPNAVSSYLFNLIIMWMWLNLKKLNNIYFYISSLVIILFSFFTKTRTTVFASVIFLILLYLQYHNRCIKKIKKIAQLIVPSLFLITYVFMTNYTDGYNTILKIDNLLTGRIKLSAYVYNNYGLTFWGQPIEYLSKIQWDPIWQLNSFTFDNLYSEILCNLGIIWMIVVVISIYLLIKKTNRNIDCFIIAWALYGITEVAGVNTFYCFPLIFLTKLLTQNKNTKLIRGTQV